MSHHKSTKIEHSGAKHTKGYWGTKQEAKKLSKRLRREQAKKEINHE
jgi:hypothetical protein